MSDCCGHHHPSKADVTSPNTAAEGVLEGAQFSQFRIEQMDCPTEQTLIED